MLAAAVVMLAGLLAAAVASQRAGYRLGGVMVVPLLVVYTLREPFSPLVFVLAAAAAWGALYALREYTLNYGRRVFLVAVVVGAVSSLLVVLGIDALSDLSLTYRDAEVAGSIFPGVAAYNLMRVDDDQRPYDLAGSVAAYLALLAVGVGALFALSGVETGIPPVLLVPTSDVVAWLDLDPVGHTRAQVVPAWLTAALLLVDVALYELVRARYDLRLAGVILIPLVAVFGVRYGGAPVVYALGATAAFFVVSLVHWVTLLYGRNLLAVGLATGVLYALVLGVLVPANAPGIMLFFIGLFTGVGAYNLHRTAPDDRPANIRLSAGLFVVFYGVLLALVDVPGSAFVTPLTPLRAGFGLLVVVLAVREVVWLERSTPDRAAFAAGSVFAATDPTGDPELTGTGNSKLTGTGGSASIGTGDSDSTRTDGGQS